MEREEGGSEESKKRIIGKGRGGEERRREKGKKEIWQWRGMEGGDRKKGRANEIYVSKQNELCRCNSNIFKEICGVAKDGMVSSIEQGPFKGFELSVIINGKLQIEKASSAFTCVPKKINSMNLMSQCVQVTLFYPIKNYSSY